MKKARKKKKEPIFQKAELQGEMREKEEWRHIRVLFYVKEVIKWVGSSGTS